MLAQQFDPSFSKMSARDFGKQVLAEALHARHVIVGENFRFGAGREGDLELLGRLGDEFGFAVTSKSLVQMDGEDISSTRIRNLLIAGDVAGSAKLLGRHHEVVGRIISGKGHGQKMGTPTINLGDISVVVPAEGIYAAYCEVEGKTWKAAVYVGKRPTMGFGFSVEAHLLECDQDLYEKEAILHLVQRVRDDQRFPDEKALIAQIAKDIQHINAVL